MQWDKTDIRDKFDTDGNLIKSGYFTDNGELKADDQLGGFYEKIQQIKNYFKQSADIFLVDNNLNTVQSNADIPSLEKSVVN